APACSRRSSPFLLLVFRLELQSGLARAVGERLHTAVIQGTAAIEDDRLDTFLLGAPPDQLTDLRRGLALFRLLGLELETRRGGERLSGVVVDDLRVHVRQRPVHRKPGARGAAAQLLADALV